MFFCAIMSCSNIAMLSLKRFFYLFVPLFVVFAVLVASPALARIVIDGYGQVQVSSGRVLSSSSGSGDDSSGSGSSGSGGSEESDDDNGNSSGSESGDSSSDSSTMKSPTPTPTKTETRSSDGTRTKTEVKKDGEVRTEVRLPDGTKIKTRAEEGRTRTDVYQGATKVRFEREGDRFRIKAENELGQEVTLEERADDGLAENETEDEIVVEERADLLRIRALQSKAIIERLNVQALTDLPLSVDLNTNILTVTTPSGEKQVTVLPDQAVQNMLAANVIDRLGGQALVEEVRQGNIQTLGQVIALGLRNNVPVYQVQGIKEHRFLGFFPVTTDVTVTVSAETGEVVDTDQSVGDAIFDFFSVST